MIGYIMNITSSTVLRNDYTKISSLAHESNEPIYITKNGEGDIVVLSIEAFEGLKTQLEQKAMILEAEARRLAGEESYSIDEVETMLNEMFRDAEA